MAITITQMPLDAMPSSNAILVRATSNNTAQPNFRFVCDIRNGANTTTIARLKADLVPGTTGSFFDISPILRSLVTPTNPALVGVPSANTITARAGYLAMPNSAYLYQVDLYEEWGYAPVVQPATKVSITGKIVFQGAFDADQTWNYDPAVRFPSTLNIALQQRALTDLGGTMNAQTTRTVPSLSIGAISWGSRIATNTDWTRAEIVYYQGSTTLRTYYVFMPTVSTTTYLNSFACYPLNLRALPAGNISTPNTCSDGQAGDYDFVGAGGSYYADRYTVRFLNISLTYGPTYTFLVDPCDKYAQPITVQNNSPMLKAGPIHITWWNDYGGTDTWIFRMKNRRRQEVTGRVTYGANSDIYGTTVADRIYGGAYHDVFTLNTDWLTDAEFAYLAGCMRSPRVWFDDGISPTKDASVVPTTFTEFTRMNDKLKQAQVDIAIATKNPMT